MSVRTFYERVDLNEDPNQKSRNKRYQLSPLFLLVFTLFIFLSCYVIDRLDSRVPNPVSSSDAGPKKFSATRAYEDLLKLTDLGPKVAGSSACVKAEKFLLSRLDSIRIDGKQTILVDKQQASGHYWLKFPTPFINSYMNLVNVIAMLVGKNGPGSQSLMINCHYDSVSESPGASDDIINCSAMLEILSVLSKRDEPLLHNIIFLFNGAEENPLQASHAFITQHKWAKNISAFINLEAAGLGGRECLFQAGPGRSYLIETYAEVVPYPHAQVIGEELFQAGIIPSDTDFRIFRDYGDVPGLDIAFTKYGQVYHTKYDKASLIPLGSLQRVGENILALSEALANSKSLDVKEAYDDSHNMVYFDFLGFFIVLLSGKTALYVNWFVVLFGAVSVLPQLLKIGKTSSGKREVLFCCLSTILSSVVALGAAFVLPILTNLSAELTGGLLMKWYSRHWLVIPLYCLPIAAIYATVSIIFDVWRSQKSPLSVIERVKLHLAVRQVAWTILVAFLLIYGNGPRATHLLTVPLFFISFSSLLFDAYCLFPGHLWFYVKLPFVILNLFWALYYSILLFGLFLPILGRAGSAIKPENIVGVMCLVTTSFSTMGMASMEIIISRSRSSVKILLGTLAVIISSMIIIMLAPINSYTVGQRPSPQRYFIMHTSRTFYNDNSSAGFWILDMDANSPSTVLDATDLNKVKQNHCLNHLACGYPIYTGRTYKICHQTTWIEAPPPRLPTVSTLTLLHKEYDNDNTHHLKFKITGPTHMSLMISGKDNVNISTMGINSIENPSWMWKKRPVLLLYHTSGLPNFEWILEVEAKLPSYMSPNDTFLEVALSGHSTYHNEYRTEEFEKFLSKFPEWTHVTSFISSYDSYIF